MRSIVQGLILKSSCQMIDLVDFHFSRASQNLVEVYSPSFDVVTSSVNPIGLSWVRESSKDLLRGTAIFCYLLQSAICFIQNTNKKLKGVTLLTWYRPGLLQLPVLIWCGGTSSVELAYLITARVSLYLARFPIFLLAEQKTILGAANNPYEFVSQKSRMKHLGRYILVCKYVLFSLRAHDIVQHDFTTRLLFCCVNYGSVELGL